MIVPFPPGGGTDILARLVGQRLGERLGVQIVVDNRPGAGANIGMELAARAAPDGHTLLMAGIGLAANPGLYPKMSFDPLRDLAPVTLVSIAPTILASHPSVAAKNPRELVALAKAQPGRLNYGSFGSGSGAHLAAELFKLVTGVNIVQIPYKGGGPAITALIAGEVQLGFSSMLPVLPHVKAGRLTPIGVAAAKRVAAAPDVATFREAGIPYETGTWFGVLVPSGTPEPVVRVLHREIAGILRNEEIRERIVRDGAEPVGNTPKEFASFIRGEAARWAKVVKTAGIRVD
ncbi:MAG: tripartite tricarboxylate transporter substrate binding protein [Betaproteobacteria bacterium]|nr:tripartite tricarboxylate transporter substrate binding protein [Betaproteobacteria bacterium]